MEKLALYVGRSVRVLFLCLPDSLTMKEAVVTKLQEELREVKEKTGDEVRVSLHTNGSSFETTLLMITD